MTVKEAVKRLNAITAFKKADVWLSEVQYEAPYFGVGEMKAVRNALEKQIPQEPMPVISDDNEFICMICPSCQKVAVEYNDNFCRNCGQAIDWGKEEE